MERRWSRPGVEFRFRRADGTLTGLGEAGVVEVRSPQLAAGYRHRPAKAAAAFVDGWYCTGDVARLDTDGYLHVLGRAVDLAAAPTRADGTVVTPTAVEDVLCRVPDVRLPLTEQDKPDRPAIRRLGAADPARSTAAM